MLLLEILLPNTFGKGRFKIEHEFNDQPPRVTIEMPVKLMGALHLNGGFNKQQGALKTMIKALKINYICCENKKI